MFIRRNAWLLSVVAGLFLGVVEGRSETETQPEVETSASSENSESTDPASGSPSFLDRVRGYGSGVIQGVQSPAEDVSTTREYTGTYHA